MPVTWLLPPQGRAAGFLARYGLWLGLLAIAIAVVLAWQGCSAVRTWRMDRATQRADQAEIRAAVAETNLAGAHADAGITAAARAGADQRRGAVGAATQSSMGAIDEAAEHPQELGGAVLGTTAVDPRILRELQAGDARLRAAQDRLRGTR